LICTSDAVVVAGQYLYVMAVWPIGYTFSRVPFWFRFAPHRSFFLLFSFFCGGLMAFCSSLSHRIVSFLKEDGLLSTFFVVVFEGSIHVWRT
jgi:ABC-type maltose transport system permease subunit